MKRSTNGILPLLSALICAASSACGGPPPAPTLAVPPAGGPPSPSIAVPSQSGPAFDVHEWGLVDVNSKGARLLAGPPSGGANWNAPRKKPVLYFHLAEGTPSVDVAVAVTVAGGRFVERVPQGELSGDGRVLTWPGLRVRRETCHADHGAPTKDVPACNSPDGLCEASALPAYEAEDAACIESGGVRHNLLFYRADGPVPPLPYEVSANGQQLTIKHVLANDLGGVLLYVHNDSGVVTFTSLTPPPLGKSITAAPPVGTDVAAARRAIDASMMTVGLTAAEVGAFDRAWTNDLFGDTSVRKAAKEAKDSPPVEDYLLFVMPESLVDGASKLTIAPPARSVRRFLLVRLRV